MIVGASGNAGTALPRRLGGEPGVGLVGVARRPPAAGAGAPYDASTAVRELARGLLRGRGDPY